MIIGVKIIAILAHSNNGCIHNQQVIRFFRRDRSSPLKKNVFVRFYHRDTHYYVSISHNTSVPMIGHLELAVGMLTSHASWAWLNKNLVVSRHEVSFFSYASEQIWIWYILIVNEFLIVNATNDWLWLCAVVIRSQTSDSEHRGRGSDSVLIGFLFMNATNNSYNLNELWYILWYNVHHIHHNCTA